VKDEAVKDNPDNVMYSWPLRILYLVSFIIALVMIPVMFVAYAEGCTDPDRSREILLDSGYTQVEILGHAWLGCGQGDNYATAFKAVTPRGHTVYGAVCCGITKSCTVRLDR
jgi:hypothetical protein